MEFKDNSGEDRCTPDRLLQTDVLYSWSPARKPFGLAENDDGLDHNYIIQYSIISVVVAPNLAERILSTCLDLFCSSLRFREAISHFTLMTRRLKSLESLNLSVTPYVH